MRRADVLALTLLTLLVLAVGLTGMVGVPFGEHESYIAQIAQNMLDSGHWVTPQFNGEPRLDTPPLVCWTTALVAWAVKHGQVTELTVRLPSVLAGLILVWMSFAIARGERGTAAGVMAGLIVVTSFGFFLGVHSGRPDMLYAMLAFAVFCAYWLARRSSGARQCLSALAIWLALGLDILAQGPQFGVLVVVGCLLHDLISERDWRGTWRRFRPVAGLVLLALVVGPWSFLLNRQISTAPLIQPLLSGSLLAFDPVQLFSGAVWLRALELWLPWLVPIVPALILSWRGRSGTTGLLFVLLLLPIAVFSLDLSFRHLSMLPTVGFAATWLALGSAALWSSATPWARIGVGLQVVLLFGMIGYVLFRIGPHLVASVDFAVACAVMAILFLALAVTFGQRARAPGLARWQIWSLLGVIVAVALMQAATVPRIWSAPRFYLYHLVREMAPYRLRPMAVLLPQKPNVFVYYLDRPVHEADNLGDLCRWTAAHRDAQPLVLFNPNEADRIEHLMASVHPLLQSPGNQATSVIVASVSAPEQCASVRAADVKANGTG